MAQGADSPLSRGQAGDEDRAETARQSLVEKGWPRTVIDAFLSQRELAKGPVVSIENLQKGFEGNVVIKGLSLHVFEGELFGIVGVSGSGKTTLLELIAGLGAPDKGTVVIKDPKTGQMKPMVKDPVLRSGVGFSPQVASVYPELTVRENLLTCARLLDVPEERISSRIEELARALNLGRVLDKKAGILSRGLQKKADVACALINDPAVLILDEPVRDLDPLSRKEVYAALKSIHGKGTTIIISSHALEELACLCTRIGVLHQGSLVQSVKPQDVQQAFYEIRLVTDAGRYGPYKERLDQAAIAAFASPHALVIRTTEPELVLRFLVDSTQALHEQILDLKVSRPRLEDLFEGWVRA